MNENEAEFEQPSKRPLEEYNVVDDAESTQSTKRIRTDGGRVEVGLLLLNADIGRVIGKGGEKIKSVREETGATIHIPKSNSNSYERTANVIGSIEQVTDAVLTIANIICQDNPIVSLLAEYRNLGAVIGKGGANINQIREETQANVHISKECLGNSTQKEVRITGGADVVTHATRAIIRHLADGKSTVRVPYVPGGDRNYPNSPSRRGQDMFGGGGMSRGMLQGIDYQSDHHRQSSIIRIETTIWVPKDIIGKIIGRGGCHINAVRKQSGAKINVENANEEDEDSPERRITITGHRKSIDMACAMIENLTAQ